ASALERTDRAWPSPLARSGSDHRYDRGRAVWDHVCRLHRRPRPPARRGGQRHYRHRFQRHPDRGRTKEPIVRTNMRLRIPLLAVTPCCLLLAGGKPQKPAGSPPGKPEVKVSLPLVKEVIDYEYFTGYTQAYRRVELRPNVNVTGYTIEAIKFQDGEIVPK